MNSPNDMPSFDYNILETLGSSYCNSMGKQSGYGMMSQYDSKTNTFVHKDMWVEGDHAFQEI